MDPSLPSDLDFDKKVEPEPFEHDGIVRKKINFVSDIQNYTVRGKTIFNMDEIYQTGSLILENIDLYEAKSYDDPKSLGLMVVWEKMVGYVKRYLHVKDGFIYVC
eukprot:GHVR01067950.1.p1 GENE.GHVR01067950.1~~GHVR01067950.1.p1  ORF type:complete len:105 (+),score=11.62 GHVR01067950.1:51-365(+)